MAKDAYIIISIGIALFHIRVAASIASTEPFCAAFVAAEAFFPTVAAYLLYKGE